MCPAAVARAARAQPSVLTDRVCLVVDPTLAIAVTCKKSAPRRLRGRLIHRGDRDEFDSGNKERMGSREI